MAQLIGRDPYRQQLQSLLIGPSSAICLVSLSHHAAGNREAAALAPAAVTGGAGDAAAFSAAACGLDDAG